MKTAILGGGITGLFAAYYLNEQSTDNEIILVEKDARSNEASVFNGGLIVPTFAPNPSFGMLTILSSTLVRRGPLYLSLGQILRNPSWYLTSLRKGLSGYEEGIMKLGQASMELYLDFFKKENLNPDVIPGVLGLYRRSEDAKQFADRFGGRLISSDEIRKMGYKGLDGGVKLDSEISINPRKLCEELLRIVSKAGVEIVQGKEARLEKKPNDGKSAQIFVDGRNLNVDRIVVTAGCWTRPLLGRLGFDSKILPASGLALIYNTKGKKILASPTLLEDYGIALAQHDASTLRITSFFEMVGFRKDYGASRKRWLVEIIKRHVADLSDLTLLEEGVGLRPCTPDQFPLIGAVPGYDNVYVSSGNCRLGITLAPATAFLLKSILSGNKYLEDIRPLVRPERFTRS